jgi:hypothetical protein
MKQMTEYTRIAGYLNKIYALLNERYFENALLDENKKLRQRLAEKEKATQKRD